MPESTRRTHVRGSGPRPVESSSSSFSSSASTTSRGSRDSSGKKKHHEIDSRNFRESSYTSHSTSTSASSISSPRTSVKSRSFPPKYAMDSMGLAPSVITAGRPFQPAVMIRATSSYLAKHRKPSVGNLVAVASLVAETPQGRMIMPTGVLQGGRMVDSAHQLPPDYIASLPRGTREGALGYFSFPDLTVNQPGVFCVRITLMELADVDCGDDQAETLLSIDTNSFRVDTSKVYSSN